MTSSLSNDYRQTDAASTADADDPTAAEEGRSQLVPVPATARPPVGRTGGIKIDVALKRAEAALAATIDGHAAGLRSLIAELGMIATSAADPIDPPIAARLLSVANDLRGIATPLGAPLVGEIANVICDVVQRYHVGSAGAAPLVQMLYHALHKAHEAIGRGDRVQHEDDIRTLLAELRAKIAAYDGR
jgi:hypothetical protein